MRLKQNDDALAGLICATLEPGADRDRLIRDAVALGLDEQSAPDTVRSERMVVFRIADAEKEADTIAQLRENLRVRLAGPVVYRTDQTVSFLTRQLIVRFHRLDVPAIRRLARDLGLGIVRGLPYVPNGVLLQAPHATRELQQTCALLQKHDLVDFARPNAVTNAIDTGWTAPSDPYYGDQLMYLNIIEVPDAWKLLNWIGDDITYGSPEIVVAVLDKGADENLGEFSGLLDDGVTEKKYEWFDFDAMAAGNPTPAHYHGNQVSSVATARVNDSYGVGVAPNCRFMNLRRMVPASDVEIAEMIWWTAGLPFTLTESELLGLGVPADTENKTAALGDSIPVPEPGADVICVTWRRDDPFEETFFGWVLQCMDTYGRGGDPGNSIPGKGTVVVVAAGKEKEDKFYLAMDPRTIATTACSTGLQPLEESQEWPAAAYRLDVCAPTNIFAVYDVGETALFGGTSATAPQVAGAAALMLSGNPSLSAAEVKDLLRETAAKITIPSDHPEWDYDEEGYSTKLGYGLLNVRSAVYRALGSPPILVVPKGEAVVMKSGLHFMLEPLPPIVIAKILEWIEIPIRIEDIFVLPPSPELPPQIPVTLEAFVHNAGRGVLPPMKLRLRSGDRKLQPEYRTHAVGGGQVAEIRHTFNLHAILSDGALPPDLWIDLVDERSGEVWGSRRMDLSVRWKG